MPSLISVRTLEAVSISLNETLHPSGAVQRFGGWAVDQQGPIRRRARRVGAGSIPRIPRHSACVPDPDCRRPFAKSVALECLTLAAKQTSLEP